ncbi:mitochondrial import inner membrane translocase subunit Tim [Phlyctema vagabunda]|uniref:Mitochondrial import inner membrane translocase subunit Tim21 n=1 Tax=Phlyctema vagabunda TaxID=108571 RepID=A0ABR4PYM7_9HELO
MSTSLVAMHPLKALPLLKLPVSIRPLIAARMYATQTGLGTSNATPKPRRKAVTAFNDDGRVAWGDLSAGEKAARTTQQSFNFGLIIVGTVLTGGVAYLLYTEVFSPDSKTAHFNRAADRVKSDERCVQLLGASNKIKAFGEPTSSKWARAGPIASTTRKDQRGVEHLIMHFNVEGPLDQGVVNLHMTKRPSESDFVYKYLYLDVKGQQRIYLENADTAADGSRKSKTKFFGIEWTR